MAYSSIKDVQKVVEENVEKISRAKFSLCHTFINSYDVLHVGGDFATVHLFD